MGALSKLVEREAFEDVRGVLTGPSQPLLRSRGGREMQRGGPERSRRCSALRTGGRHARGSNGDFDVHKASEETQPGVAAEVGTLRGKLLRFGRSIPSASN